MIVDLAKKCEIQPETFVSDVDKDTHVLTLSRKNGVEEKISADRIILAVGRAGSRFFEKWCKKNGVPLTNNQVDLGVRVELPYQIWQHFSD